MELTLTNIDNWRTLRTLSLYFGYWKSVHSVVAVCDSITSAEKVRNQLIFHQFFRSLKRFSLKTKDFQTILSFSSLYNIFAAKIRGFSSFGKNVIRNKNNALSRDSAIQFYVDKKYSCSLEIWQAYVRLCKYRLNMRKVERKTLEFAKLNYFRRFCRGVSKLKLSRLAVGKISQLLHARYCHNTYRRVLLLLVRNIRKRLSTGVIMYTSKEFHKRSMLRHGWRGWRNSMLRCDYSKGQYQRAGVYRKIFLSHQAILRWRRNFVKSQQSTAISSIRADYQYKKHKCSIALNTWFNWLCQQNRSRLSSRRSAAFHKIFQLKRALHCRFRLFMVSCQYRNCMIEWAAIRHRQMMITDACYKILMYFDRCADRLRASYERDSGKTYYFPYQRRHLLFQYFREWSRKVTVQRKPVSIQRKCLRNIANLPDFNIEKVASLGEGKLGDVRSRYRISGGESVPNVREAVRLSSGLPAPKPLPPPVAHIWAL